MRGQFRTGVDTLHVCLAEAVIPTLAVQGVVSIRSSFIWGILVCWAPKQIRDRSKISGLQQRGTGREGHTYTHTRSLAASPDLTPNVATLGALGLRPKTSPAQIQTVFISTATFENREGPPHRPPAQLGQPLLPQGPSLALATSCRRGKGRGRMAQRAVPRAGSGRAWAGPGGRGSA